jgi:hypothetical protein
MLAVSDSRDSCAVGACGYAAVMQRTSKPKPDSKQIPVRVSAEQHARWAEAAWAQRLSLQAFITAAVDAAVEAVQPPAQASSEQEPAAVVVPPVAAPSTGAQPGGPCPHPRERRVRLGGYATRCEVCGTLNP